MVDRLLTEVHAYVDDDDASDVEETSVVLVEVHVLNRVFPDCIHDNEGEDVVVEFHRVDSLDNKVVVEVVGRREGHCFHDRRGTNLRVHNNLYFQKNHYMEFFCIKNLNWWSAQQQSYDSDCWNVSGLNATKSLLMNENRNVENVWRVEENRNVNETMIDENGYDSNSSLDLHDNEMKFDDALLHLYCYSHVDAEEDSENDDDQMTIDTSNDVSQVD